MEVSGADFFWPLCLDSPTLSRFMSKVKMFLDLFLTVSYSISRRAEFSCVWEARRKCLCLPNGANDCCAGCEQLPLLSSLFFLYFLARLASYSLLTTSAPLCHLHKLVKSFLTGKCHLFLEALVVLTLLDGGGGVLPTFEIPPCSPLASHSPC